jgi:hypothetical protein
LRLVLINVRFSEITKGDKMKTNKIKVDQRSNESAYITVGDWVIYVDNSTNEKIISTWTEGKTNYKTFYATPQKRREE